MLSCPLSTKIEGMAVVVSLQPHRATAWPRADLKFRIDPRGWFRTQARDLRSDFASQNLSSCREKGGWGAFATMKLGDSGNVATLGAAGLRQRS
ncbi:hypothetical protein NL676_004942 [Syzygium grande]|nr:hypothetical protein NL676_004942 [Syzygium grande]